MPDATYQGSDLWNALEQGRDLGDSEIRQLKLTIDNLRYSAQSPEQLVNAEILDNYAQEKVIENKIEHLQDLGDDYWEYRGLKLERIEAETAVQIDIEHYWENEKHLKSQELQEKLKEYAVGLWNFMYGDDINTLLDNEAHPLARVWAAAQIFPVMKFTKAGKLLKLVKFNTKGIPLTKMLPLKVPRTGFWSPGSKRVNNSVLNAYNHFLDHKHQFPGIQNAKQYVEAIWKFMDNPPSGTYVKVLEGGQKVLYHPPSNTVLFTLNGMPQSMYKPDAGIKWLSEPLNKGVYGGYVKKNGY